MEHKSTEAKHPKEGGLSPDFWHERHPDFEPYVRTDETNEVPRRGPRDFTDRVIDLWDLKANKGETECGSWAPDGSYVCTRAKDHGEAHVAHRSDGTPIALWANALALLANSRLLEAHREVRAACEEVLVWINTMRVVPGGVRDKLREKILAALGR